MLGSSPTPATHPASAAGNHWRISCSSSWRWTAHSYTRSSGCLCGLPSLHTTQSGWSVRKKVSNGESVFSWLKRGARVCETTVLCVIFLPSTTRASRDALHVHEVIHWSLLVLLLWDPKKVFKSDMIILLDPSNQTVALTKTQRDFNFKSRSWLPCHSTAERPYRLFKFTAKPMQPCEQKYLL